MISMAGVLPVLLAWLVFAGAGVDPVGTVAAEWEVGEWINSPPLRLADLRGKVVLVRWWTAPDCPFCAASAPTLNELQRRYSGRGLAIIGFYHHKSDSPLQSADVARYAKNFDFRFPLAIDTDWKTLHRWWLDAGERGWTSVSFLIDGRGVIRYVHPGGQYAPNEPAARELERRIVELLAEL
jgi:peroxiredoxin